MAWTRANMRRGPAKRAASSRRSAKARACPKCGRLGALSRIAASIEVPIECYLCRWPDCQWGGDADELGAARASAAETCT